ncbi:hypothetical protein [Lentzea sp. NPDC004782]|uniref:hypothetical protein n=1 Tax=Lentzea sp. NPDC004782 TaxID=3154458 RepID=UPI0033B154CE
MTVARKDLGDIGRQLGRGGEASVYELPDFRLPDLPEPLVLKRYHVPYEQKNNLIKIAAVRRGLDEPERQRLDGIAAWPLRVVLEGDDVFGIVMRRVPGVFFDTLTLPGTQGTKRSLREVQNLFIDEALARRLGRPVPTDEERLRLCRDLAAGLAFMHDELGVVFGDLNAKNELFRLDAVPMVMFLDCDGVRPRGVAPLVKQLNAPDWEPPEGGPLTRATDLYKLGLFILRCLTPGRFGSIRVDPAAVGGRLDPTGLAMLRRALGATPNDRPSAREWLSCLRRLLGEAVAPPRLGDVALDRRFLLSGGSVGVSWEALDASEIVLKTKGHEVRIDGGPGRGVTPIVLDESGFVEVTATNALGADSCTAGPVTVVEPPAHQQLPVAVPDVPWPAVPAQEIPQVDLVPLPGLPSFQQELDLSEPARPPAFTWPDLPRLSAAQFPLDLTAMFADGPELDLDLRSDGRP